MRPHLLWLAGAALALAACGSSSSDDEGIGPAPRRPVPGCEQYSPAPCDVETAACQRRLFDLAGCLRGSDAGDLPPISVMTEPEFASHLEEQYAQQDPVPHLAEWEQGLAMLGLITPGALEADAEVAQGVKFIYGVYEDDTKSIILVDHGSDSNAETSSAVLLHEFVHTLQDRDVDLAAFHALAHTYDEGLATDAVVEGEAEFQQERYMASMLGFDPASVDWDRLFQNGVDEGEAALFKQDSVMTAAWDIFPYALGARLIHVDWTGHDSVLELFEAPPLDTQLEMASATKPADDVRAPEITPPEPPSAWSAIGDDVLGAFGTFELLGQRVDLDRARDLALAWRGDRLALYASADAGGVAVVWTCDFANGDSATATASALTFGDGVAPARVSDTRLVLALSSKVGSDLSWAYAALGN